MRLIDKANINLQLKLIHIITHLMYLTIQISNLPHIQISCSTINTLKNIHIHPKRTNNKHQKYKYNLNSKLLLILQP